MEIRRLNKIGTSVRVTIPYQYLSYLEIGDGVYVKMIIKDKSIIITKLKIEEEE